MREIVFVVEKNLEGGYAARALSESIFTQANDLDSLKKKISDAVDCHFEAAEKPTRIRLHCFEREKLRSPFKH